MTNLTKTLLIRLLLWGTCVGCSNDSTALVDPSPGNDDNGLPAVSGYPVVGTNQAARS